MITTACLNIIYLFVWAVTSPVRLLSDVSLSSNLINSISTVNTYVAAIDFVFPVTTFLTILGLVLTIEAFIILYKLIMWVIRKIRTVY